MEQQNQIALNLKVVKNLVSRMEQVEANLRYQQDVSFVINAMQGREKLNEIQILSLKARLAEYYLMSVIGYVPRGKQSFTHPQFIKNSTKAYFKLLDSPVNNDIYTDIVLKFDILCRENDSVKRMIYRSIKWIGNQVIYDI